MEHDDKARREELREKMLDAARAALAETGWVCLLCQSSSGTKSWHIATHFDEHAKTWERGHMTKNWAVIGTDEHVIGFIWLPNPKTMK